MRFNFPPTQAGQAAPGQDLTNHSLPTSASQDATPTLGSFQEQPQHAGPSEVTYPKLICVDGPEYYDSGATVYHDHTLLQQSQDGFIASQPPPFLSSSPLTQGLYAPYFPAQPNLGPQTDLGAQSDISPPLYLPGDFRARENWNQGSSRFEPSLPNNLPSYPATQQYAPAQAADMPPYQEAAQWQQANYYLPQPESGAAASRKRNMQEAFLSTGQASQPEANRKRAKFTEKNTDMQSFMSTFPAKMPSPAVPSSAPPHPAPRPVSHVASEIQQPIYQQSTGPLFIPHQVQAQPIANNGSHSVARRLLLVPPNGNIPSFTGVRTPLETSVRLGFSLPKLLPPKYASAIRLLRSDVYRVVAKIAKMNGEKIYGYEVFDTKTYERFFLRFMSPTDLEDMMARMAFIRTKLAAGLKSTADIEETVTRAALIRTEILAAGPMPCQAPPSTDVQGADPAPIPAPVNDSVSDRTIPPSRLEVPHKDDSATALPAIESQTTPPSVQLPSDCSGLVSVSGEDGEPQSPHITDSKASSSASNVDAQLWDFWKENVPWSGCTLPPLEGDFGEDLPQF
ncbi:hypothetical protein C8R43DRAFT_1105136 [Mycena crocata]|nr:hypothetical protein C8R43DRAFT_1105136 [Mycena crocata]